MKLLLAKHAGVCYGVFRALKKVNEKAVNEKVYTYGQLTHNREVIQDLERKGVYSIDCLEDGQDGLVALRAHGVPPAVYFEMLDKNIRCMDCTCPDVKNIHSIVYTDQAKGRTIVIIGDEAHPEIVGIKGFAGASAIVIGDVEMLRKHINAGDLDPAVPYSLVVQTTFTREKFICILSELKKLDLDINIYDTICTATVNRQKEAEEIAKQVEYMIVLGDKTSSNTTKLYESCKKHCKNTFFIQTIHDLQLNIFSTNDKIGITAGASTPPEIIKEAFIAMSELERNNNEQSFEEMLNESLVTLHTGSVVKGTVIQVANGEVSVNLGYKSDGIIPKSEFSEDPTVDPAETVKPGDTIEVFVTRVNDGEGNVSLSKKRVDAQRNYDELEAAFTSQTPIKGKIIEIVRGGLIAVIGGVRVFVPSSQVSNRYVEDLTKFKGQEFNFNIIEFDKAKRRFVAGRKNLATQELAEKKEKVFASLEVGKRVEGVVSRIVDFGAFVDLGGVDGLIHISELAWGRIKKVRDVLAEGDKVIVTVLELDKEKGKISLSLKDISNDPWNGVAEKYPIGQILDGKVVRMVPFGVFVELESGVDGLVHISQISTKHVVKAEDVLRIGEIVKVKVTEVDSANKRISLSIKEAEGVLEAEDAPAEEEALVAGEVSAVEETPVVEEAAAVKEKVSEE